MKQDAFVLRKKIYYHDTDCGGVVYYANYLKYLEEARTEFFLHKGINLKKLAEKGVLFVVARISIDYKAPSRYQDILQVSTTIDTMKSAAIFFSQKIKKDESLIAHAKTTLVSIGKDFKPIPIPKKIKYALVA